MTGTFVSRHDQALPFEFEVLDSTGSPSGFFISVIGADTNEYRKRRIEVHRARLENPVGGEMDAAVGDSIEMTVAGTVSWRGDPPPGIDVQFSAAAGRKLYDDYPTVGDQASNAIHRRENFLPRVETS